MVKDCHRQVWFDHKMIDWMILLVAKLSTAITRVHDFLTRLLTKNLTTINQKFSKSHVNQSYEPY